MALGSAGLYPLAVLSLAFISYAGGAVLLHVSGFAAVYVTSLVLGRAELPHRMATRSFVDGIAWLAQIGLFVMLGLLASPGRFRLNDVLLALVIGIAVTVVGRFASVAMSAAPFRLPWREQTFIAWAGLRGAVPIVLATIPLAEGVPQADRIFDVVFVLVLLFTLLQGPSLPWLARRLGVLDENAAYEVDIDVAPLESLGADMLQVHVPSESRLAGVEIGELRLPAGVSVSLIIRGDRAFVPDRRTVLRAADSLLVVAPSPLRDQTVRRLRAVSRAGRLAGWFGERGREQLSARSRSPRLLRGSPRAPRRAGAKGTMKSTSSPPLQRAEGAPPERLLSASNRPPARQAPAGRSTGVPGPAAESVRVLAGGDWLGGVDDGEADGGVRRGR